MNGRPEPGAPAREVRWPERFVHYCRVLRGDPDPRNADKARGELWMILNSVLFRSLCCHASRYGHVPREELEDIAAQKSLDLLRRLENGDLDLSDRLPPRLNAYLSSVADKGLMDLFRRPGRRTLPLGEETEPGTAEDFAPDPAIPDSEKLLESKVFAKALRACADGLEARARAIWIFRVFFDMSSKQIASHPEVRLKPGHVDVILQRVRASLRDCMQRRGYDTHELPSGLFVELWRAFRMDAGRLHLPGLAR